MPSGPAAAPPAPAAPAQADSDATLIRLWLAGRSPHTARAFLAHTGKPLRAVTVGDVQAFGDALAGLAPASRALKLPAVKSLLGFAYRLGYLAFDVGAPVRLPAVKETLAERIVGEAELHRLLALEPNARNCALLTRLYIAGLRISEDAGQVTVFGKGGRTRMVLLPAATWRLLIGLRRACTGAAAADDAPVSAPPAAARWIPRRSTAR